MQQQRSRCGGVSQRSRRSGDGAADGQSTNTRGRQARSLLGEDGRRSNTARASERKDKGEDGSGAGTGQGKTSTKEEDAAAAAAATADPTAEPDLDEHGKLIKSSKKIDYRGKDMRREDFDEAEEFVLYFFKRMLAEWESELDARPKEVRVSERWKLASATQKQTRQFIRPLFKLLKSRQTSADILKALAKICTACLERKYNLADEAYLTMSIGNAAWPMGVTMVSIHERAGRTKLFSQSVAHVLNDETQRKYIQSVKRLMTYCQTNYPTPYSQLLEGK